MPRRISDYPDSFAGWNLVSSFGSIISVIATGLFLYIVYNQLVEGKTTSRYPWYTPQFFYDILQAIASRSFNSLEWGLSSPPKAHAYVSLPLQSAFTYELLSSFLLLADSVIHDTAQTCLSLDFSALDSIGLAILACLVSVGLVVWIFEMPMPGVRCPRCLEHGEVVWVLPGKHCRRCNCPC